MKWFLDRANTVRIGTTIAVLVGIAFVSCASLLKFQAITQQDATGGKLFLNLRKSFLP
jgi:hypothetical protein